MEGLDIFPLNAPTLNKMRMNIRKIPILERVKQETRKTPMRNIKLCIP